MLPCRPRKSLEQRIALFQKKVLAAGGHCRGIKNHKIDKVYGSLQLSEKAIYQDLGYNMQDIFKTSSKCLFFAIYAVLQF